jgi:hypothetical protein
VSDQELKCFCDVTSRREYSQLWPVQEGQLTKTWSLDYLFAFLCELETGWRVHDCDRRFERRRKYPDGYFEFSLDFRPKDNPPVYARAILVTIPGRCTPCRVKVSRQWIAKPQGWSLDVCMNVKTIGRTRSPGHGLFF